MWHNDSYIASIKFATTQINRHGALLVIIIGTIGNLLNTCVLADRSFRNNPCSVYLWWSSIFSIAFIWSGLSTRVLDGYGISWPNQNPPLCKIRLFILVVCWSMATWAFVGASMDRYLSSSKSTTNRLWSTNVTARRFLITIFIFSVLVFAQVFYCFRASVPNVPVACYSHGSACQLYNDWMNILYNILIPSGFMTVFCVLTMQNVRTRIVCPVSSTGEAFAARCANYQSRGRKTDQHFQRILLIQVFVLLLLNLPIGIQRLYVSLTSQMAKVAFRVAIENLIYSIIVLISFIAYSMSFYLCILNGSKFRAAFKSIIHRRFYYTQ